MIKRFLLLILTAGVTLSLQGQQRPNVNARSIITSTTGIGKTYSVNRNEPPRAIELKERTVTASGFIANINQYLAIPKEFTFTEIESNSDALGMKHHLLQQYYRGIPMEGMLYRVHERNGYVTSVNGKGVRNVVLDANVILTEEQAFAAAVKHLTTKDSIFKHGKKLIVSKDFTFAPESFSIAFQFDIDVSLIESWRISIDVRTGEVINKVSLVNTCFDQTEVTPTPSPPYTNGTGLTNYYGNQSIQIEKFDNSYARLVGQTEHGGSIGTFDFRNVNVLAFVFGFYTVYDFYSPDGAFNDPYQKPAVSVQWAAERAYEYYFTQHGRNSYDNAGSAINSYVHVDNGWNNAAWSRTNLLFGDGTRNAPLVELDVVSHELTHGVTQYEAQLQYYGESGALNESFSDILGKAVEFNTFGDSATWQLAKHYQVGGLRDMSNPNLKNQPDTFNGDMWYTGYEDSGGVHYNSGVQNYWYYLLCKGGSGVNDHQVSYSVNAIGMDAATKIVYRNLTEYLTYFSDYLDSRIGSLLATSDLYGKNSAIYQEVDKAWDAVGVINEPIIISVDLYDITGTTVKIKSTFLPRGDSVTYHFEYGTTPQFGSSTSTERHKVDGINVSNTLQGIVTGLQSETKYYLRLVATNENGSSYAATDFTTISLAPLVKIKQTVDVTETTATFYGQINPNSLATTFYFEYGTTPALGLVTPSYPLAGATEFLNVSDDVTGLQPRQTYYYRLVATNGFSTAETESVSFFTAVKPVITSFSPVAATPGTEITITGQNFNPSAEKNLVRFGASLGEVLSSGSTTLKVIVPAGSSFGTITVLDAESGLVGESVNEFVPTFKDGFKKGDLQLRVGISTPYIWKSIVQDMDGDNKPDIVAIHYQAFSVYQNVNQGGDITEDSFVRNTFNVQDLYSSDGFQVIDFDGNGLKDIVTRSQNGVRIYPNFSVPGYIFFGTPVEIPFKRYLSNLEFKDFDQDGHIDIAGNGYLPGDSSVFAIIRNQNPKGSLFANNFEEQYLRVLPYFVYFLTSGDLNNDSKPELILSAYNKRFVSILKNLSHPGFFEFEEHMVQDSTRGRFVRYDSHDINQDGWKDIVSHSPYESGNLALLENNGSPNLSLSSPTVSLSDKIETMFCPGDMNGDGKVDLIVSFSDRKFVFLENTSQSGQDLTSATLRNFEEYGTAIVNTGSGTVDTRISINDLNGDGRPEVINAYSYNYGPHDGYQMEIWQNAPPDCLDPSTVRINVSNYTATIVLPPNTTMDQFEIELTNSAYYYWSQVYSTTMNLSPNNSYQLKVRAKCYLGYTDYYYINFTMDCVDTSTFSISTIGAKDVILTNYNLYSFEIQFSQAGKNEWVTLSQYSFQITNLVPGTTYDIRYRGRCYTPIDFKYIQFTTLCPNLTSLAIYQLSFSSAVVTWSSNYTGKAMLEYSDDNLTWTLVDATQSMYNLTPGKKYFVRGKLACTDINSGFIYTNFTTPCPKVSSLSMDDLTPYGTTINWTDESNSGQYSLTYALAAGGPVTNAEVSSTSFKLDGLNPGTQYSVTVTPHCIGNKEITSQNFTTVCYVPSALAADAVTYTSTELTWRDNFGTLPYFIDYSIASNYAWQTLTTTSPHITLTELRPATQYEVRVHIQCLDVKAPFASLKFYTANYTETAFSPNPTEGEVTIYPSKNLIGNHFTIHTTQGKLMTSGELLNYTFDFSGLAAGVYILNIDGESPVKIVKH